MNQEMLSVIRQASMNFYHYFGGLDLRDVTKEDAYSIGSNLLLLSDSFKLVYYREALSDDVSEKLRDSSSSLTDLAKYLLTLDNEHGKDSHAKDINDNFSYIIDYFPKLNFEELSGRSFLHLSSSLGLMADAFNRVYQRILYVAEDECVEVSLKKTSKMLFELKKALEKCSVL